MEPTQRGQTGLVDLLDRVLDKGLVLNADLIISLAGVPLIAVSLNAVIASVETMARYGLMRELIQPASLEESKLGDRKDSCENGQQAKWI